MYEYKSVEVLLHRRFKVKKGTYFYKCMDIIHSHAKDGWRLVQIVTPVNEKMGVHVPFAYQIIFEKKHN